jgi:archaellum component FlaG (FlaF/FlaG flagellin family)
LALGTGFRDDEVTVLLDGREVWHGRGLTTDYSVDAAVVPLPSGTAGVVEVRVGSRSSGSASVTGGTATGDRRRAAAGRPRPGRGEGGRARARRAVLLNPG